MRRDKRTVSEASGGPAFERARRYLRGKSIQFMISTSFTLVAIGCMVGVGFLLYTQFTSSLKNTMLQENQQLVNQVTLNVTNYTRNMMRISDSMYYSAIKKADISEPQALEKEMDLLYEANRNSLISIACFTEDGAWVASSPVSVMKPVHVTQQEWFTRATTTMENLHFSAPHVQNLFIANNYRYYWVVSLSRVVELTRRGQTSRGVLLVDMNYSGIEQIFSRIGTDTAGYVYLIDPNGEIIYHPKQRLIYSNLYQENNLVAAGYSDGLHEETFQSATRQVVVKTVGYTGWRVVSVIPNSEFAFSFNQVRLFVIAVVGFAIILLIIVNSFVSSRVANPIKKLEQSVKDLEHGSLDLDIYVGGPYEIEHLGSTIRSMVEQMRGLMREIVREQEDKRRSEFDALQAQINPHFLYNTLGSIVWMIESGRYKEAISMVTALANLFRISLSQGSALIPIRNELQHARHYLYIQNIRYKNKFTVKMDVDPEIEDFQTIKLIIQPLLENAIYHAMELMDGDGVITLSGRRRGDDVYIEVRDNGLGIPQDKLPALLTDKAGKSAGSKRGSGIGLRNVHQRIRLYYGEAYGLEIESEVDVGTTVYIHLPVDMGGRAPESEA
ncbi:MAG: sensor histidine kinase [Oscillospiraceae bacterium]|jgi:two-component system sensor histidine kinase YesM|nr:sensor histidine kinase [Oscillospiraceae bacterium]